MADLERVSLRQVGKGAIGRVYKGNVADAFNRFSQPSIPTMDDKFLSPKDTREAFGMSSERFNIKRTSDIPGPGVYDSKKIESPSYSKKGYGGITNKTARFKKFQYNTLSPGPGYYDFRISNSSNNAPMITYPKSKSLSIPTETPGVGFYDPFSQSSLLKDGFTSNFKSKSKRLEYNDSISPPPWQYNIEPSMFNQKTDKITAAFQKPLNAKRQPVNLYDPHSPVPEEMMPGPGAYSLTSENTHQKPSAAFVEGNVDRFGKPVKVHKILEVLPGPGTYTQTDEPSASEITSAAFKDEQKRMYFEVKKLPGPAFYSPVPVAVKKSFHMNFNNTWV